MVACAGYRYKVIKPTFASASAVEMARSNVVSARRRAQSTGSVTRNYTNSTGRDYYVVHRDQVRMRIPAASLGMTRGDTFMVEVIYTMQVASLRWVSDFYRLAPNIAGELLEDIKKAVAYRLSETNGQSDANIVRICLQYVYNDMHISEGGGIAFLPEHDILLEQQGLHGKVAHPASQVNNDQTALLSGIQNASMKSLMFGVRIIDNTKHKSLSDRYINFGGEIFHIGVERDPDVLDGVHLIVKYPANHKSEGMVDHRVMTPEQADEMLGLARTAEDAKVGGGAADLGKRLLEKTLQEMKIEELDKRRLLLDLEMEYKAEQARISKEETVNRRIEMNLKQYASEEAFVQNQKMMLMRDFKEISAITIAVLGFWKVLLATTK